METSIVGAVLADLSIVYLYHCARPRVMPNQRISSHICMHASATTTDYSCTSMLYIHVVYYYTECRAGMLAQ